MKKQMNPNWKLTEKELDTIFETGGTTRDYAKEIAKAQARKLVEWLEEQIALTPEGDTYKEKVLGGKDLILFRVLLEDWQQLLKEVGGRQG